MGSSCTALNLGEQRIELALVIQFCEFCVTADVALANVNLWHRLAPSATNQLDTQSRVFVDQYLLRLHTITGEQCLRHATVRAHPRTVHEYCRHGYFSTRNCARCQELIQRTNTRTSANPRLRNTTAA